MLLTLYVTDCSMCQKRVAPKLFYTSRAVMGRNEHSLHDFSMVPFPWYTTYIC